MEEDAKDFCRREKFCSGRLKKTKTRNVTVCNRCPRRPLKLTFDPDCDLKLGQGSPNLAREMPFYHALPFCEV